MEIQQTPSNSRPKYYLGNPTLRGAGYQIEYTPFQLEEIRKCMADPLYFFENYIHIINVDEGKILYKPFEFQKRIVKTCVDNRFVICKIPRQMGKTTTVAALLLWYVLFNHDFGIAVLAHKAEQAREILSRIQLAYEMLPFWMQQGVTVWNKGDIAFENGSFIETGATSSSAIRGKTFNIVYMDELAHIEPNVQEEFFTSTYPTISSGKTTKILITSTPKGLEYFYKIWMDSVNGKNSYARVEAHYWEFPGREDPEWRKMTIGNTSERQFAQEFECDFLGSADTLIDGRKLAVIPTIDPIGVPVDDLYIYDKPIKGNSYVITVDTSRGAGIDYSAFVVFDVTKMPHRIVARYRNNTIPSVLYPNVIHKAAKHYNDAFVLVENNDVGAQVADILHMDLDYANMFTAQTKGRAGQVLGGLGAASRKVGVNMSRAVKRIGCNALKTIVEQDRLVINDQTILNELSTFVVKKDSYAADEGKHDDLVMCLVSFAWLVHQEYFKELFDFDLRRDLEADNAEFIEADMTPFGIIDNGSDLWDGSDPGNYTYDDRRFRAVLN